MSPENSVQDGLKAGENIDAGASSSLPPKQNTLLTPLISFENCKYVLEDGNRTKDGKNEGKVMKWKVFNMKPCLVILRGNMEFLVEIYSRIIDSNVWSHLKTLLYTLVRYMTSFSKSKTIELLLGQRETNDMEIMNMVRLQIVCFIWLEGEKISERMQTLQDLVPGCKLHQGVSISLAC
ncbi:hypothetical protein P8452_20162 [Trifolium repens]|nr:hypothetical protein P8452_20162 [Trifolium repens]